MKQAVRGPRKLEATKSLEKAFLLLNLIAAGGKTLTELARDSGLPVSTAHRLLADLLGQGVVVQRDRIYKLGVRLIELGEKAKRELPIRQVALEPMQALAKKTQETVHLGVLDGSDIVYLEKVTGDRGLQMASYVGLRTPAQCTAMGKALIASLPEDSWSAHFHDLPPRTPHTIGRLSDFLHEIDQVRAAGYALDREENELGIRCVAAVVWGVNGTPEAAISISGATVYIDSERQEELAPDVVGCARAVSGLLGARLQ